MGLRMPAPVGRVVLTMAAIMASAGNASAQEACRQEPKASGRVQAFSQPLDEATRMGLSAAIFIALSSDKPDWPLGEMIKQQACAIETFIADGSSWTLSGGVGSAPPRFARSEGRADYIFLAAGPGFDESYEYIRKGEGGAFRVKKPTSYLVLVRESARHVLRVYDGYPTLADVKSDMIAALENRFVRIGVYDPASDAVTVSVDTKSGIHAQLFRPPERGHVVTIWGPDGKFYAALANGATRLRGSGFACPSRLETFDLTDMKIFDGSDEKLDLTCRFFAGEAWISAFVSRFPEQPETAAVFSEYRRESTSVSKVVSEDSPLVSASTSGGPDYAVTWIDEKGLGQSLSLTRRGLYYIELRATYPAGDKSKTASAARSLQNKIADVPLDIR